MGQEYQFVCDGCGTVVHGRVKAAFIHKDYIQLKGTTAILQLMDQKTKYRSHIFLTKEPCEDLTFCLEPGLSCLEQYVDRKRTAYEVRRREHLKAEASEEFINRRLAEN